MTPPPNPGTATQPAWVTFVPAIMIGLVCAGVVLWLAPRKGCSKWWALVGFVPCFGSLVILYVLSLTDKQVLDDIADLKRKVEMDRDHKN
jgi:hypothetical protein